jgi:NtrC-family two-component system sensor histidine kinase KinB
MSPRPPSLLQRILNRASQEQAQPPPEAVKPTQLTQENERRLQQLAALESINRELSATRDLQRLFETMVARAMEATGATSGQLGTTDSTSRKLVFVAWQGAALEAAAAERNKSWPLEHGGVAGRVLRTGQAARVSDVRQDPDYIVINPNLRSELCVPIAREGRQLGVIVLESERLDAFSEADQKFVEQLAVQAAMAIDNARLDEEIKTHLREQSLLYEAGATLSSTLDPRQLYRNLAKKLAESVNAEKCVLLDYEPAGETLRMIDAQDTAQVRAVAAFPTTGRVLRERTPLVLRTDDPQIPRPEAAALQTEGYGTLLQLPMVAADQVIGLVQLYSREPRDFTGAEIRLAQTLANQAAVSIQNARLFRSVSEGRDRLAAVLNSTREGVLVLDASGLVSLVNPPLEEIWGVPAERIVGRHMLTLIDTPDLQIAERMGFQREEIQELLLTLRAGLALSIPKAQFQISAPKPRFLERSGAPVLDQLTKAIGWVIILRDVTEEKEIEEVRRALSGMIVHDLRSPLTAILASMNLIRSQAPDPSAVMTQALEVALRSTNKLLGLVNTLLDISRMESGEVTLNRSLVNLGQLVEEVIADLMPLANEYGVFLINQVQTPLPSVWIDREKVSRVFTNLIDNALKFTPAGSQVLVCGAYAENGRLPEVAEVGIQCAVLDSGPGIPEEYQDKIFDRFSQIHGRQGRRAGTGLGLAFCKLAIEAHGGTIWVENRPEGGSKFSFTLPINLER